MPAIDLDNIYWSPGWIGSSTYEMETKVGEHIAGSRWVAAGNYSLVRHLLWSKADTIIWLDLGFWIVFRQLLARTIRRVVCREPCCNGNYETWLMTFSSESIVLWFFKSFFRNRREMPILLSRPQYAHLEVVRLKSRQEVTNWLAGLDA
jgi:adenylate kinase family enzyme